MVESWNFDTRNRLHDDEMVIIKLMILIYVPTRNHLECIEFQNQALV